MVDYSATITVNNGAKASTLTRGDYKTQHGSWATPPPKTIATGGSGVFKVDPAGNVSEAEVNYTNANGTNVKITFLCAAAGNSVSLTPADYGKVTYNQEGAPLFGTIQVFDS